MIERSILDDILDELDRVLPGIPNDTIVTPPHNGSSVTVYRGAWRINCLLRYVNAESDKRKIDCWSVRFDYDTKKPPSNFVDRGPPSVRFYVDPVMGASLTDCVARMRAAIQAEVEFLKGV